jgi:hypothetical protein
MNIKNKIVHCHDGKPATQEWLTPPNIIKSLGEFDLDPCSPVDRPWPTAKTHYTVLDDGLSLEWFGRVWLNPPFDRSVVDHWMKKMAELNNGIALLFARTDRNTFHKYIFPIADSILFIKQRLHFYNTAGQRAVSNCGAPCLLIGYGSENSDRLAESGVPGTHVPLKAKVNVIVVGIDKSWRTIIQTVLMNHKDPMSVDRIYRAVEEVAPEKVKKNKHFKEKIRQQLQQHFTRSERAHYCYAGQLQVAFS